MALRQRQGIDELVQFLHMLRVKFTMHPVCPEKGFGEPCPAFEVIVHLGGSGVALQHEDIAKQPNRVMMIDPIILASDKRGGRRQRDPVQYLVLGKSLPFDDRRGAGDARGSARRS